MAISGVYIFEFLAELESEQESIIFKAPESESIFYKWFRSLNPYQIDIIDVDIDVDTCIININSDATKVISYDFIHVSTFRI